MTGQELDNLSAEELVARLNKATGIQKMHGIKWAESDPKTPKSVRDMLERQERINHAIENGTLITSDQGVPIFVGSGSGLKPEDIDYMNKRGGENEKGTQEQVRKQYGATPRIHSDKESEGVQQKFNAEHPAPANSLHAAVSTNGQLVTEGKGQTHDVIKELRSIGENLGIADIKTSETGALSKAQIEEIQGKLKVGKDGVVGHDTLAAIDAFALQKPSTPTQAKGPAQSHDRS